MNLIYFNCDLRLVIHMNKKEWLGEENEHPIIKFDTPLNVLGAWMLLYIPGSGDARIPT